MRATDHHFGDMQRDVSDMLYEAKSSSSGISRPKKTSISRRMATIKSPEAARPGFEATATLGTEMAQMRGEVGNILLEAYGMIEEARRLVPASSPR